MTTAHTYRATAVYGSWYDGEKARGFEGHFVASLAGKIGTNRIRLAKFITPIFQKQLFQEHKLRISPGQIRIRFEREQLAIVRSRFVRAEFLEMTYRGKERNAIRSAPKLFELKRQRRKKKITKRAARRVRKKRRLTRRPFRRGSR